MIRPINVEAVEEGQLTSVYFRLILPREPLYCVVTARSVGANCLAIKVEGSCQDISTTIILFGWFNLRVCLIHTATMTATQAVNCGLATRQILDSLLRIRNIEVDVSKGFDKQGTLEFDAIFSLSKVISNKLQF